MTENSAVRLVHLSQVYDGLLALARTYGFDTIEEAIKAHDQKTVAWMHDGENRFDVVHDTVRDIVKDTDPDGLRHYSVQLVRKVVLTESTDKAPRLYDMAKSVSNVFLLEGAPVNSTQYYDINSILTNILKGSK